MNWTMGRPKAQATDVIVRFEQLTDQTCRVTLTHENWERMDDEAKNLRNGYNNGWIGVFEKGFGGYAGLVEG